MSGNIFAKGNSPNEKLNIACIGVGGRGSQTLPEFKKLGNIVAMADVDDLRAAPGYAMCPDTPKFHDWRVMFDKMENKFDAVTISTPDHSHFPPARAAMLMKKHVFCEKPLGHSVAECRILADLARKQNIQTQLGNQRHATNNMHRTVEIVQSGLLGDITEVHAGIWGGARGMPPYPKFQVPAPDTLNWDLWLGAAKKRPFAIMDPKTDRAKGQMGDYAPYFWHFWWDFGTGETGNWGCHVLDIPFWALDLKYPTHVKCIGGENVDKDRTPKNMIVEFQFPKRKNLVPCRLIWDTTRNPESKKYWKSKTEPFPQGFCTAFVGTKGVLFSGLDRYSKRWLFMNDDHNDLPMPEESIPKSPGFWKEWTDACTEKGPAPTCQFDYSGPLSETALLANVAFRAGRKEFQWDAESLTCLECPEAQKLIKPELYNGFVY